jgi:OFA family oxalate/formate antiporter-like MFS transporter
MVTAWIVSFYGASVMLGMLAAGLLSDRLGREKAYSIGTIFIIAGCVALLVLRPDGSIVPAVIYAGTFGFGFGSRPSMDAATVSDIFGGKRFGFIFGTLSTALGLGMLGGPVLAGAVYDVTGSYDGALVFCMFAVCVATGCIWLAAPRKGREEFNEKD